MGARSESPTPSKSVSSAHRGASTVAATCCSTGPSIGEPACAGLYDRLAPAWRHARAAAPTCGFSAPMRHAREERSGKPRGRAPPVSGPATRRRPKDQQVRRALALCTGRHLPRETQVGTNSILSAAQVAWQMLIRCQAHADAPPAFVQVCPSAVRNFVPAGEGATCEGCRGVRAAMHTAFHTPDRPCRRSTRIPRRRGAPDRPPPPRPGTRPLSPGPPPREPRRAPDRVPVIAGPYPYARAGVHARAGTPATDPIRVGREDVPYEGY